MNHRTQTQLREFGLDTERLENAFSDGRIIPMTANTLKAEQDALSERVWDGLTQIAEEFWALSRAANIDDVTAAELLHSMQVKKGEENV